MAATAAHGERPNVLLIVCDDLNNHVSTSGYQPLKTPGLEKLAAAGMTFSRAYCQYPVCGPSRASFLSGLYPESSGILNNTLDIRNVRPGTQSMPQVFKTNDYWTASVGKVFHNINSDPGDVAWHEVIRFNNEENPVERTLRKAYEAEHGPITDKDDRSWHRHLKEHRSALAGQTPPGYGPTQMRDEQHKDGKNVRQVTKWLDDKAHANKPFFIACGIQKPHVPFWAPQKYFDQHPLSAIEYRPTPNGDWKNRPPLAISKRYQAFGFELEEENDELRRKYTQAYHACISFIDAQISLLFDALQRNGRWDDTIIILTSDHGYHLGEHALWGKVTLFEECARVPMIVRVPGLTKDGANSEALVELVDLFPTLVELCAITGPNELQGNSLVPLLENPNANGRLAAYTVVSRGKTLGRSIHTSRWHYGEWGSEDQAELYDLINDPYEDNNLASNPRFAEQRRQMHSLLIETRKSAESKRK
ncbi:sulfatase [Stieleria sp. TO1_6]|uniref:sulfatase n=1 Tax=Stieleria tagensis TaxID=2956795 RepID=UPI00209ADD1B|nr:sulfatase [Stieleria tagensis]MCO8121021.1 sulfatase [Stieleria tagensis]